MRDLTGTGSLVRLILRRDRVWLPVWIIVVALVPVGFAASAIALYPTAAALQAYADESMNTPAAVAMLGRVFSSTVGGVVAWRTGLQSAILIAPVSMLLVIRHTRTEEEKGRRELLGSTVTGRLAPLTSALIVVFGANLVIAAFIAAGLVALGLPAAGSVALGLSAAAGGCVFAAVAAVAAQLTESAGAARGVALSAFGLLYVLRVPGDVAGLPWLTWFSPLGWMRQTRAFAGEEWWVFALFAGLVVVLAAIAYAVSAQRDLGAGLLPARLGPANASPELRSPLALAWRLQRGALFGWAAAFAALGAGLGAVGPGISSFVDAPQFQEWAIAMGAQNAGDAFLFVIVYVLGQVVSAYAIGAVLESQSEEDDGRAESLLSAPVSRLRWAASHLLFGTAGPAVVLLALGLTMGLTYGVIVGDAGTEVPRILARVMRTLPAVWVMAGLAAALYGWLPRFTPLVWAALALFLALEFGWEVQRVSQTVFDMSPFAHVHWARETVVAPLVWLTAIAVALAAAGLAGFQRRDIGRA